MAVEQQQDCDAFRVKSEILSCRLCLTPTVSQISSLFEPSMRCKLDVVFKFEFSQEKWLPIVVCPECTLKIDEFYTFHENVRVNQTRLTDHLGLGDNTIWMVVTKEEPTYGTQDEEPEHTVAEANINNEATVESDNDAERNYKQSDSDEPDKTAVRKEKSEKLKEDNLKIEQFFNGISCNLCPTVLQTFDQLKAHGKKQHGKNASITCCKKKYYKKSLLVQHINAHLDPKQFYCEVCNKNYTSKYYLGLHMQKKHSDPEDNRFDCNQCGRKFPRQCLLTAHLKTHIRIKCKLCDRLMANIYSLNCHMQKMHPEGPRKSDPVHICDTCGQSFQKRQSLERHINLQHLGVKDADRGQCSICEKWFNKPYLKIHLRNAHSGENLQVKCTICQQIYPNTRALSTHKYKVHIDRNLKCEICNKKFKTPKALKEHRAAHMGQRLYSCTVCKYTSNYNGNLYGHMKNKHPTEWAQVKASGGPLLAEHS